MAAAAGDTPYTDAWAKYANMGKGLGAGLTRTRTAAVAGGLALLRERASDATMRRESEAEARLRRAGNLYD